MEQGPVRGSKEVTSAPLWGSVRGTALAWWTA